MRIFTSLLLASVLLVAGCDRDAPSPEFIAEWEQRTRAEWDTWDRQDERYEQHQAKIEQQAWRIDDLLDKWEEQARRYDAILTAMEKQHGLKK